MFDINNAKNYFKIKQLHADIAFLIHGKGAKTLRELEEMTFNQYSSGELGFFELKESITKLENFFLLYSVENKYDIC